MSPEEIERLAKARARRSVRWESGFNTNNEPIIAHYRRQLQEQAAKDARRKQIFDAKAAAAAAKAAQPTFWDQMEQANKDTRLAKARRPAALYRHKTANLQRKMDLATAYDDWKKRGGQTLDWRGVAQRQDRDDWAQRGETSLGWRSRMQDQDYLDFGRRGDRQMDWRGEMQDQDYRDFGRRGEQQLDWRQIGAEQDREEAEAGFDLMMTSLPRMMEMLGY